MDYARRMLDELLGPDRNLSASSKGGGIHYDHPDVCKMYLTSFCPYQLLANTKSAYGNCPHRYHEEHIRREFEEKADGEFREECDIALYRTLLKMLHDLDRT